MKTCPDCNNILENNVTICPYCGRNVIGITTYDYGLEKKGQVVDKNLNNEGVSEKIYGNKKGIRAIEDEEFKNAIEVRYNINFRKNSGLFIAVFFLLALIDKPSTYKALLLNHENKLYVFLLPVIYSILMFLAIHLKLKVTVKVFITVLLSAGFVGLYWFYGNIFLFEFKDTIFKPLNIGVLVLAGFTVFIKYKKIKLPVIVISFSFILYSYFIYLESLNLGLLNVIFLMKLPVLFAMGLAFILFLSYDLLFFYKK